MAQLAKATGGFEYRTVPTSGGAEQVLKLLAGDVQAEANSAAATVSHLKSGAIRALLVFSTSWPELEKMGVPLTSKLYGFSARNLSAVVAPAEPPGARAQEARGRPREGDEGPGHAREAGQDRRVHRVQDGPQIRDAAVRVQAEQLEIGKILDKVKK